MKRKIISTIIVFLFVCFLNIWLPPPKNVHAADIWGTDCKIVVEDTVNSTSLQATSGYVSGGKAKDYYQLGTNYCNSQVKLSSHEAKCINKTERLVQFTFVLSNSCEITYKKANISKHIDGVKVNGRVITIVLQDAANDLGKGTPTFYFKNSHPTHPKLVAAATCTTADVVSNRCVDCGMAVGNNYYSGNALGHSASAKLVSNATCTTAAVYHDTCDRCGAQTRGNYYSGNALGHSFTSQTVNNTYLRSNATCTAPATYFYKCSRCAAKGTTFYNSGSALGHSNNNVWVTTKNPTCLEDGSKHTNCSRCGAEMNVTAIPKLGHVDNGIWVTETESTCTGTGSKHTNCARCNAVLNETVLDALGHVWDSGTITTAPTVYRTGIRTFTCQTCHETVTEIEPQYQFTIFAGTTRVRKIAKGTSILFENTTNTDDQLPFIVSTGTAIHE